MSASLGSLALLYNICLKKRPCLTKALTAAVLNALEELSAQALTDTQRRRSAMNLTRVFKMSLYGLLLSGPLNHFLYQMLEQAFDGQMGMLVAVLKILASNLLIAPVQTLVYLVSLGVISKLGPEEMDSHITRTFWPMMKQTWIIFPVVTALAQYAVPVEMHTPFYSLIGFLFGVYFNIMARRRRRPPPTEKAQ